MNRDNTDTIIIFTDAATSPKSKIAIGSFLCLDSRELDEYLKCDDANLYNKVANHIVYKKYETHKSTWAEIKTVIDACLIVIDKFGTRCKVRIYSDCKSVYDLLTRRKQHLEKTNYITKSGIELQNASLYRELFAISNKLQMSIFNIKGHAPVRLDIYEKIFDIVDKLSRRQLRDTIKSVSSNNS